MPRKGAKRPLNEIDSTQTVLTVKKSSVPEYLRNGAFYLALGDDEDENATFEVPSDAMKESTDTSNCEELVHLLRSLRFWGVADVVEEIVDLVVGVEVPLEGLQQTLALFEQDFPYLVTLNKILLDNSDMTEFEVMVALSDMQLIEFLHDNYDNEDIKGGLTAVAAQNGHLHCLQFLHENGYIWHKDIVWACIEGGNVECLKYVQQHHPQFSTLIKRPKCYKITTKTFDCFLFCVKQGAEFSVRNIASAFLHDGLESTKRCVAADMEVNESIMGAAIWEGKLDCVKYLHEECECFFPEDAATDAALRGDLPLLKYLHDNRAGGFSTQVTRDAARHHHLECLKFLHSIGCPWNHTAYHQSTENQVCNEYLEQNGCEKPPWMTNKEI